MSYFYIDSTVGSRTTGGGLTKQSGSFTTLGASSVYATIAAAITDGASSGDIICVSTDHAETDTDITIAGTTSGDSLYIYSVDPDNCDTQEAATSAQVTASDDIALSGRLYFNGIYLVANDDYSVVASKTSIILENCIYAVGGAVDKLIQLTADDSTLTFINSEIKGVSTENVISIAAGSTLNIFGGSVTGKTDYLTSGGFNNAGGHIYISGCDLSSITGTLFKNAGSDSTNDDLMDIVVNGCKLNSGVSFLNEALFRPSQRLSVFNSSSDSAASEYQFYIEALHGHAEDHADNGVTTGIHRDESTAFESGRKVSAKCVTTASATIGQPFWFELPARFAELSSTSTDTLRIYLACTSTLYDDDVYIDIVYAKTTTNQEYAFQSSKSSNLLDINATELTDDTASTWKDKTADLESYNEYQIDVDTAAAGDDCVPIVRIFVTKPSVTIYFDTTVGTV